MKRLLVFVLVFASAAFALCAKTLVSESEIDDERVLLFMEEYAGGFSTDEYVSLVDTVSDIFFSYDDEYGEYTVYIVYPEGTMAWIVFLPYQINMSYVDSVEIPQDKRGSALELINKANSDDYDLALGTLFMDDGFLCSKYITLDDGVTDFGEWSFWNFCTFESYSMNATTAILQSLGLR